VIATAEKKNDRALKFFATLALPRRADIAHAGTKIQMRSPITLPRDRENRDPDALIGKGEDFPARWKSAAIQPPGRNRAIPQIEELTELRLEQARRSTRQSRISYRR